MSDTIPAKKVTRVGAGRTKGSTSFVLVTLEQLKELNPNPNFKWMASRKQLEDLGATGLVTGLVGKLKDSVAGQSVETAPKVHTEEFE